MKPVQQPLPRRGLDAMARALRGLRPPCCPTDLVQHHRLRVSAAMTHTDLEGAVELLKALSAGNKLWAPHTATPQQAYDLLRDAKAIDTTLDALASLKAENERLHERLGDNFAFDANGERVAFEPGTIPNGIECRDETIKQQRELIERLTRERDAMRGAIEAERQYWLKEAKKHHRPGRNSDHENRDLMRAGIVGRVQQRAAALVSGEVE